MRRRTVILYGIGILLLVSAAFAFLPSDEPSYQGRTLTQWVLESHRAGSSIPEDKPTANAILQIGPRAVPYLVNWIGYEQPAWKADLSQYLGAHFGNYKLARKIQGGLMQRERLADVSLGLFEILGPAADAAVPELAEILNRPCRASDRAPVRTIMALAQLGPKGLPPLLTALADPTRSNRWYIVHSISLMGTNARPAIPVLLRCLKDPAPAIRQHVAHALTTARAEPSVVVPALIESFEDPKIHDPLALQMLSWFAFGAEASNAVPTLRKALDDPDPKIRSLVTNTLRQIASQALENAPR